MGKKLTLDFVKEKIESRGWTLLSQKYVKDSELLEMRCDKEHNIKMTYTSFQQGTGCSICRYENMRNGYQYVKEFIESHGYTLTSTTYKNNIEKLDLVCDKGHSVKMSFSSFKSGCRCKVCNIENQRLNYDDIKKYVESEGYTLLTSIYTNNRQKLSMICDKGHECHINITSFKNGQRCSHIDCNSGVRLKIDDVKDYLVSYGYTLLSTVYINSHQKIKMRCPNGHILNTNLNNFKNGRRCCCSYEYATHTSKQEKDFVEYLKSIYTGLILENDRTILRSPVTNRPLELDVVFPNINKAIEFNGVYWHSKQVSKQNDCIKKHMCREYNIDLLIVTDFEWMKEKESTKIRVESFLSK